MTHRPSPPLLKFRVPARRDPRNSQATEALLVLASVAAEDADYAKQRNGRGFNKADSTKGHALAKVSLSAALGDEQLLGEILRMAARYRRQASLIAQGSLL